MMDAADIAERLGCKKRGRYCAVHKTAFDKGCRFARAMAVESRAPWIPAMYEIGVLVREDVNKYQARVMMVESGWIPYVSTKDASPQRIVVSHRGEPIGWLLEAQAVAAMMYREVPKSKGSG